MITNVLIGLLVIVAITVVSAMADILLNMNKLGYEELKLKTEALEVCLWALATMIVINLVWRFV